eukprot:Gb_20016 [translate_table: standard]
MITRIQNHLKSHIADFFQIPLISEDTFFSYLGVPIGARKMKVEDWMPFLEKIRGQQATYCPVGWNKVTAPLWKGGLRIRDPYLLEDVRGAKRCWDFLQAGQRKWKEVLLSKYYYDLPREDMLRGTQPRRSGSDAWKLIAKNWEEVAGRTFPSPGHEADDNGLMDYQILRAADQLNEELSQVDLRIGDTILAKIEGLRYGSKASVFESKSFYENIHQRMNNPRMMPYPVRWHWIWWQQIQNKHNHIHWRLAHKAFICSEIIHKWRVAGPIVCQMCMEGQPDLNHLWWQCPKIRTLWYSILEIFSIEQEGWLLDKDSFLVHPFLIKKSWEGSYQWFPNEPPAQMIWRLVFKTTLYIIWIVQMQAFFNKREVNTEQYLGKILSQTHTWIKFSNLQESIFKNLGETPSARTITLFNLFIW